MESPERCVELIRLESERNNEFLSSLTQESLRRPSACDRWEVRDLAAHLVGAADHYEGTISRAVHGDFSPPKGAPPAGERDADAASDASADAAIALRERLGDNLLPALSAADDRLNSLLAGLSPQDWDKHCYHSARVFPVRRVVAHRLMGLVMHGWDARWAVEAEPRLSEESLPAIVDVVSDLSSWLFRPGERMELPLRCRFELNDVALRDNDVVVDGDSVRMEPAAGASPDVVFRCDAETYLFLTYARITFDSAVAAGRLKTQGDPGLVRRFGSWFQGA